MEIDGSDDRRIAGSELVCDVVIGCYWCYVGWSNQSIILGALVSVCLFFVRWKLFFHD